MAPAVTLIDLDDAAPPDRKVKLGGKEWRVPGDAPVDWLLQFRQLETADLDELEQVERMRDLLADLFLIRQPDREDEILAAIGEKGAVRLLPMVGQIYANPQQEVAPVAADPPRPAGTRSTSNRSRSRSRSSGSSAS